MQCRLFAAAFLSLGASVAAAASVSLPATLDQLVAAGDTGVTIGDKQFYDFSVLGQNTDPSLLQVVQAPGSLIGIEFRYNWTSTNGNNIDSLIRYKVHVTDPARSIIGIGAHFDGSATGNGSDLLVNATITETVSDLNMNVLGEITLFNGGPQFSVGTPPLNNNDSFLTFPTGQRDLEVEKDITVHSAVGLPGVATISLVDQTFQQTMPPTAAPLPPAAWTALSTLGLASLTPGRRRFLRLMRVR